jgi:GT2 family glycosyltransferase
MRESENNTTTMEMVSMSRPQVPQVTLIVIHYNSFSDTHRCLTSLRTISYPSLTIVVIDNSEDQGSSSAICRDFPEVHVLRPGRNAGFAAGNNKGISYALDRGSDYFMLLNNDTEILAPNLVSHLVALMDGNPDIGLIAPRVVDGFTGMEQANILAPLRLSFRDHLFRRKEWVVKERAQGVWSVPGLSGVCLMLSSRAVKRVGMLDEAFFMYEEDNDFCFRIRQSGYDVVRTDVVAVKHYQKSVLNKSFSSFRHRMHHVNKIYLLRKHGCSFAYGLAQICLFALRSTKRLIFNSQEESTTFEARAFRDILSSMLKKLVDTARQGPLLSSSTDTDARVPHRSHICNDPGDASHLLKC